MSNRTLMEFNHDYLPKLDDAKKWAEGIIIHLRTGDRASLPKGVTFKHSRHHSEPCPLEKQPSDAELLRQSGYCPTHRVKLEWLPVNNHGDGFDVCPKCEKEQKTRLNELSRSRGE